MKFPPALFSSHLFHPVRVVPMNDSQLEAVLAPVVQPLIVVAPPGSGKTTCLINRVTFALESGVLPEEILLLTFTNKAAKEIRERSCSASPAAFKVTCSTFHSFCLRICRQYNLVPRTATVWGDAETKKAFRMLIMARLVRDDPNAGKIFLRLMKSSLFFAHRHWS
jgi:superfamily I DNA/RNA helicase